jgi:hypothetical protein
MRNSFLAHCRPIKASSSSTRRRHLLPLCFTLLVLCWFVGMPSAKEPKTEKPARAKDDKPYAVTYDVSDLIYKVGATKPGYSSVDNLMKTLMAGFGPERWHGTNPSASTIQAFNDTKLEIHTTAVLHAETVEYLNALRRNFDCAVDLNAILYEVDLGFYEKQLQPKLVKGRQGPAKPFASPVDEELAKKLQKQAILVKSSKVRIAEGKETQCFSLRKAITYISQPSPKGKVTFDTAFYGVRVKAAVAVAPDRRTVRVKLTQEVTDLVKIEKETMEGEGKKEYLLERPEFVESSSSATFKVEDGQLILLPLHCLPKTVNGKKRVKLLLIQPIIYIEEEEKLRRKLGP